MLFLHIHFPSNEILLKAVREKVNKTWSHKKVFLKSSLISKRNEKSIADYFFSSHDKSTKMPCILSFHSLFLRCMNTCWYPYVITCFIEFLLFHLLYYNATHLLHKHRMELLGMILFQRRHIVLCL